MNTNTDFLSILFSGEADATAETPAQQAAREIAEMTAERAARIAEEVARRCPRCMGEGRLAQFTHRKGGECFACGGTGLFTRF